MHATLPIIRFYKLHLYKYNLNNVCSSNRIKLMLLDFYLLILHLNSVKSSAHFVASSCYLCPIKPRNVANFQLHCLIRLVNCLLNMQCVQSSASNSKANLSQPNGNSLNLIAWPFKCIRRRCQTSPQITAIPSLSIHAKLAVRPRCA